MSASESQSMSGSEPDSEEVSGSGDESMQESGDSESEEEQEILGPKVLPARGTRGNRMNTLIAEEDSADEDFWQQEFFAEEGKDEEYEKSSEGEDEADTDFSESESESDEENAQEQKESVRTSRHKPLKPPGSKKLSVTKPKQPLSEEAKALQADLKAERLTQQALPGEAPTLRHSTRIRVEEAQQVRQRAEKVKPKRVRPQVELRPLTQDELLAEAARTELDNLRDLEQMVALEEATRKKAMYKRSKYSGPMIRFHSKRIEEVALTMVEVVNMPPPPHMLPMKAPKPPAQLRCAITGKAARYRDPVSGYGYADLGAYKELKQRLQNEKRGLMTGKRTKRQAIRAPSVPRSAQEAMSDSDAVHHTGSGAVQDNGADSLPEPASTAPEAAAGMPTANTIAAQASVPASGATAAATSETQALPSTATDVAGHSKSSHHGTAELPVSGIPDETAVHAAIQDSNSVSSAAISPITGASVAAATQVAPHGRNAAVNKGATANAAADSTVVQAPTAHGASTAPNNASALVVNAPK
ncbi:TPA: hypothetical protein ACH3X1_003189 [Trebouxia sp. C0004]